jgi:Cu(I)/Ag(I) efflux system protein CusF
MTRHAPILAILLLAGCGAAPEAPAPAATEPNPPAAPAPAAPRRASATGVVEAVDAVAKTVTIAHGPVDALGWPGMTMAFRAPDVDLSTLAKGDKVAFEFDSAGLDNTIVSITKQ